MNKQLAVFNSDQVSLDGTQFSISALEDGIWLTAIYGVPSNYSHDLHRPVGWSYAKGLYFEPEKVLTIGYFLIATDQKDMREVNNARKIFLHNMQVEQIAPYADQFKAVLDKLYEDGKGTWFCSGVVLYGYKDIVKTAFPGLAEQIKNERDELVPLNYLLEEFTYLSQGIFQKKNSDLCIIAHPYFRKSLSIHNNFHWLFLDELVGLQGTQGVTLKLKLDMNFIGYTPSFVPVHEFEYWWGPKYNDDITAIQPGLTQYASDEFEKEYYQIERTEFVWKQEDNLYTLELEEVKDEPAPTLTDTYGCRYVHSIFDREKDGFDHFDGAIRAYDTELMLERIEKKMTEMGRRSKYTKLFRVDGNLPLANWKSLVTNYLQGNPQIYEYFGLSKPGVQAVLEEEPEPTVLEKYVPYSISKGDGVRLYVSYHPRIDENERQEERYFSSYDLLNLEDGQHQTVEHFTVDVMKALVKNNADITLPNDYLLFLHEDYYHNVPCIFHTAEGLQKNLNQTIKGIKYLLENLEKGGNDHILSFSLAWNLPDKRVNIAVMGHGADLYKWFTSFLAIPVEREALKVWMESQSHHIKANGKLKKTPVLSSVVCDDGMLFLNRRLVKTDAILSWPKGSDFMEPRMEIAKDKSDLVEALKDGVIYPAPSLIIKKMICEKTGLDYSISPYSSYFGEKTVQVMEDATIVTFHWTDKARPIKISD